MSSFPVAGKGLIERLMRESKIPMIKHLDGICHTYIDDCADLEKAAEIAFNAKCQRYGTCNTMETLLVASAVAQDALALLAKRYQDEKVELRAMKRHTKSCMAILTLLEQPMKTGQPNIWPRYWQSVPSTVSTKRSTTSTVIHPNIPMPSLRKITAMRSVFCGKWIRHLSW